MTVTYLDAPVDTGEGSVSFLELDNRKSAVTTRGWLNEDKITENGSVSFPGIVTVGGFDFPKDYGLSVEKYAVRNGGKLTKEEATLVEFQDNEDGTYMIRYAVKITVSGGNQTNVIIRDELDRGRDDQQRFQEGGFELMQLSPEGILTPPGSGQSLKPVTLSDDKKSFEACIDQMSQGETVYLVSTVRVDFADWKDASSGTGLNRVLKNDVSVTSDQVQEAVTAYTRLTYRKQLVDKEGMLHIGENGEKEIHWTVYFNLGDVNLLSIKDAILRDRLEEGLAYREGTFQAYVQIRESGSSVKETGRWKPMNASEAEALRQAFFDKGYTVPEKYAHAAFKLVYVTDITERASGSVNRYNNAEIGIGDKWYLKRERVQTSIEADPGTDPADTEQILTKRNDFNGNREFTYTIRVNEGGATLNDTKPLTLTDTMGYGLEFIQGSLKATDESGNAVEGVTVKTDTLQGQTGLSQERITLTLPDATPVVITYRARLLLDADMTLTDENSLNSVILTGKAVHEAVSRLHGRIFESSGTASGDARWLRLVKKSADGDKPLAGAVFTITAYRSENGSLVRVPGIAVKSVTTSGDGNTAGIRISPQELVWKIEETQAPKGYVADPAPVYMTFNPAAGVEAIAEDGTKVLIRNFGTSGLLKAVITVYNEEEPPAEDPPAEDPPTENPPTENPPTENPPTENPPTENTPPAENPPADNTPPAENTPPTATETPVVLGSRRAVALGTEEAPLVLGARRMNTGDNAVTELWLMLFLILLPVICRRLRAVRTF